jgi:hypothetical protein
MNHERYNQLAVIIPLAPDETAWRVLLPQLAPIVEGGGEILLAGTKAAPGDLGDFLKSADLDGSSVHWLISPRGRALQMNRAALSTRRPFLWFLHADSRLDENTVSGVQRALAAPGCFLWYFRLRFLADGPRIVRLNAWGAWLRSRYGGMPFGDQGFLIKHRLFFKVGAFDMSVRYGEDHLLAWTVREHGHELRWTGGNLLTSSRRYREKGWLRTTLVHAILTLKQAAPCYLRLKLKGWRGCN